MKRIATAAAVLLVGALTAHAQTTPPAAPSQQPAASPPASSGPGNSAVNRSDTPAKPGAPVAGANSFTEGQAKSRIESHGFSNVSNLKKDDNGVWRATAMKDGKSQTVSLDFQGNVVAQ